MTDVDGGSVAVREILRRHLVALVGVADDQAQNHNLFLEAISPSVAASSKLTRSLTSRLGRRFAAIARELAALRYGADAVPATIYADNVEGPQVGAAVVGDTAIYTRYNEVRTRETATTLLRWAGADRSQRIGTAAFRDQFRAAIARLDEEPPAGVPWVVRVDIFVETPGIGLAELESGGELDTANVKGQPEKLVLAGLALGRSEVPLHFSLAYANRGEGMPVAGGLPAYLAPAGTEAPSAGLLVGSAWWQRLLPASVSFDTFVGLFGEVADELQIIPADIRRADRVLDAD